MIRRLGLLLVLLALAGCAAIPESTPPQAVQGPQDMRRTAQAPAPPKGMDPLSLVRGFVENGADPEGGYAVARPYLAPGTQWDTGAGVTIIDDTYNTVYSTSESSADSQNKHTVLVRGHSVGRLDADDSFAPEVGNFEIAVHVERQSDGEWRIASLPPGVVISRAQFGEIYRGVRVYYVGLQSDVLVPDLRYVLARPAEGMASKVIDMLLGQPSTQLRTAVRSAIGSNVKTRTNVAENADGALVVDLMRIGEQSAHTRELIADQIVLSLQFVPANRVRLLADGVPLVTGHAEWRVSDVLLSEVEGDTIPDPQLPGLVVTTDGRVRLLRDGNPIPGPAGAGEYRVDKAAQSNDGFALAVVNRASSGGSELRIGPYGQPMKQIPLQAIDLTRPTWRSGTKDSELWTVIDHNTVVRVVHGQGDNWTTLPVDTGELPRVGARSGPITDLRLSRDGSRVAVVASGRLWVGSATVGPDSGAIHSLRQLLADTVTNVVSVDWKGADTLVVATSNGPVVQVLVDGSDATSYSSSNLTLPITAVTAAPGKQVVVADANGLWTAEDTHEVWRPHPAPIQGTASVPCYPG